MVQDGQRGHHSDTVDASLFVLTSCRPELRLLARCAAVIIVAVFALTSFYALFYC